MREMAQMGVVDKGGCRTYRCHELRRCDGLALLSLKHYRVTEIEVADSYGAEFLRPLTQYILGLEVSVSDALVVEEVESVGQVSDDLTRFHFTQMSPSLYLLEQRACNYNNNKRIY